MLLMGKSTISMAIFNSYVKLPEGITSTIQLKNVGYRCIKTILSTWLKLVINYKLTIKPPFSQRSHPQGKSPSPSPNGVFFWPSQQPLRCWIDLIFGYYKVLLGEASEGYLLFFFTP